MKSEANKNKTTMPVGSGDLLALRNIATDIATMMAGWNKIEAAAKAQFPHAGKDELYQICKGAMNLELGIK